MFGFRMIYLCRNAKKKKTRIPESSKDEIDCFSSQAESIILDIYLYELVGRGWTCSVESSSILSESKI